MNRPDKPGENRGPSTVAIFMDGNRRWARARGLRAVSGHEAGKAVFMKFLDFYTDVRQRWGSRNYIFYAFSTENWNRPAEEVAAIMGVFTRAFDEFSSSLPHLLAAGIRIRFLGERTLFSPHLQTLMQNIEKDTERGASGTIALAVSYGGRADIVQAVNHFLKEAPGKPFTEQDIGKMLWTADIPEPDLIIRPGGERRLSNFLTWQSVYSELAFTDTLWPDFTQEELEHIFADYALRDRRHGK
ncbi:MAG: di-trans,poly-cis-decaprenylcistransferase [Patescibacteria group bacterium]|nr:di-trans,poly-cis-decaprenylcistransferase [Patescibacteria group bacterium]